MSCFSFTLGLPAYKYWLLPRFSSSAASPAASLDSERGILAAPLAVPSLGPRPGTYQRVWGYG